jgi:photosystem II stability/assembly factor-like uncharacterized protein
VDPLDRDPLERDLRDLLTDDRLALPTHWVSVDRVHAGAIRRRRRRAAVTAVAGAVVVAAVAGSAFLAHPDRLGRQPAGTTTTAGDQSGQPTSSASGSTATTPLPAVVGQPWDGAAVTSVTATSTKTLVAVGRTSGSCGATCLRMAESHDQGRTWTALPVPTDARSVDDVEGPRPETAAYARFGSGQDGWLFGGGLWSTHDGGFTWAALDVPGGVYRLEAAAGTAWALVDVGNSKEQLWSSPVGDDDWQRVDGVDVEGPADLAVQGKRVVVLGTGDAAWTNDSGAFRRTQNPCATSVEVRLSGSGSLWATCITGTAAHLVASEDEGVTWSDVPVDTGQGALPNSVSVGARSTGEAVLAIPTQPVARLDLTGKVSAVADPPTEGDVGYLGFTTRDVGYAIVGSALWRTDDGAETWRRLDIATP